ncbi:MAG: sodium-dependent transporter [Deltaproteobacteria bacterium]|nr:sodium-dependent transporter [Deltaproteobacteria bacterium]
MSDAPQPRGGFATRIGFVLAAAGSAVGLGNIWKFPYITGEYGGGAFVLVYLFCIALVGLPLMYAELIIGRRGGSDVLGSLRKLTQSSGPAGAAVSYAVGGMAVASGFLILSFYAVVAGWAVYYALAYAGLFPLEAGGDMFGSLYGKNKSLPWHTFFMVLSVGVVAAGVNGGIERACKVLMPMLAAILGILLVYVGVTGGLSESFTFLFKPDFDRLLRAEDGGLKPDAILEALGHAFFTLSLGMGAMVTYGSYLKSEVAVVRDGIIVAILDTVIALVAGLVIFAVVFSHEGAEPGAGPGLVFVTLPGLFADMPGGQVFGFAFFVLLVFAAWSSAISLLEVVVAFLVDSLKLDRKMAALGAGFAIWGLGIWPARSTSALDLLDNITTKYMLPLGGLGIAIAAGWLLTKEDREAGFRALGPIGDVLAKGWTVIIRFVTPVLVALVILNKLGVLGGE